jgi:hypothetical protein
MEERPTPHSIGQQQGDNSYKGDASATDPDRKGDVPWIGGGPQMTKLNIAH